MSSPTEPTRSRTRKRKDTAAERDAREREIEREVMRRFLNEDGPQADPDELHREHMRLEKLYGHLKPIRTPRRGKGHR